MSLVTACRMYEGLQAMRLVWSVWKMGRFEGSDGNDCTINTITSVCGDWDYPRKAREGVGMVPR